MFQSRIQSHFLSTKPNSCRFFSLIPAEPDLEGTRSAARRACRLQIFSRLNPSLWLSRSYGLHGWEGLCYLARVGSTSGICRLLDGRECRPIEGNQ